MNEDQLINQYLLVLKRVNTITDSLRATGKFNNEQLVHASIILSQELPKMVFNEEQLKVLSESQKLKNMSFEVIDNKNKGM